MLNWHLWNASTLTWPAENPWWYNFNRFFHPFCEWENNSVLYLVSEMTAFNCVGNYRLISMGMLVPGTVSVFLLLAVFEGAASTAVNVELSS